MNWIESFLLGFIQALTEFLPVSSSGHLVIFQKFMKIEEANPAFNAFLHVGTALATIVFYRKILIQLHLGGWRWLRGTYLKGPLPGPGDGLAARTLGLLALTFFITGGLALPLKDHIESLFHAPAAVGLAFLITAGWLLLTIKYQTRSEKEGLIHLSLKVAVLMAIAQFIAVTPGISRSGATIGTALVLGLRRKEAAEFSFLMSIPVIFAASLLLFLDGGFGQISPLVVGVGFVSSFIFGLAALTLLVYIVRRGNFYIFSIYLLPLGILVLSASLLGFL